MWVLDARYKAEKVWYPVVWEEVKDASNVIDYDIHDEITKDASAVINANNQTTTGMANVIPWVNAPKLLADTSIVWIPEQEWSFYWKTNVTATTWDFTSTPWNSIVYPWKYVTVTANTLPYKWSTNSKWLVFPMSWWYSIKTTYDTTGQSEFVGHFTVYLWSTVIWTYNWWSWSTSTYQLNVNKWDVLWFEWYMSNSFTFSYVKDLTIFFEITTK